MPPEDWPTRTRDIDFNNEQVKEGSIIEQFRKGQELKSLSFLFNWSVIKQKDKQFVPNE